MSRILVIRCVISHTPRSTRVAPEHAAEESRALEVVCYVQSVVFDRFKGMAESPDAQNTGPYMPLQGKLSSNRLRTRRARFRLTLALSLASLPLLARLQAQPAFPAPVFGATSDLVLIPLHVTDRTGKTITDLRADQFQVLEEKEDREIATFYKENEPVSIGFVVDLSGSMKNMLPRALEALHTISGDAEPEDDMFVVTCSSQPHLAVDFTNDASRLTSSLSMVRADGNTALIDSVYTALQHVRRAPHKRRALIVISDGMDNHSRHNFAELMSAALEADTQIYTIELPGRVRRHGTFELLERLSGATGGLHLTTGHEREVPAAAAQLSIALRNVYIIGFRPEGHRAGKWQRVQVRLAPEFRRSMRISAKSGYRIPE